MRAPLCLVLAALTSALAVSTVVREAAACAEREAKLVTGWGLPACEQSLREQTLVGTDIQGTLGY
jgi:hypothetical protein